MYKAVSSFILSKFTSEAVRVSFQVLHLSMLLYFWSLLNYLCALQVQLPTNNKHLSYQNLYIYIMHRQPKWKLLTFPVISIPISSNTCWTTASCSSSSPDSLRILSSVSLTLRRVIFKDRKPRIHVISNTFSLIKILTHVIRHVHFSGFPFKIL